MLIGEHAVVYGYPASVCAIDQRITLKLTARPDSLISIESSVAPFFEGTLSSVPRNGPLRFVSAILRSFWKNCSQGLDIQIVSQIDPTLGLGSSAALTIALIGALDRVGELRLTPAEFHCHALKIVQEIQGRGSGADLAASLRGGCLSYVLKAGAGPQTAEIDPLPTPPQLSLSYTGYKTPTAEVLARVAKARSGQETRFDALYAQMGDCASEAINGMKQKDWQKLAACMNRYHVLMRELGVSDSNIEKIVKQGANAMAVKISGSGLGDCVLALGRTPDGFIPVEIAKQGLVIHEN